MNRTTRDVPIHRRTLVAGAGAGALTLAGPPVDARPLPPLRKPVGMSFARTAEPNEGRIVARNRTRMDLARIFYGRSLAPWEGSPWQRSWYAGAERTFFSLDSLDGPGQWGRMVATAPPGVMSQGYQYGTIVHEVDGAVRRGEVRRVDWWHAFTDHAAAMREAGISPGIIVTGFSAEHREQDIARFFHPHAAWLGVDGYVSPNVGVGRITRRWTYVQNRWNAERSRRDPVWIPECGVPRNDRLRVLKTRRLRRWIEDNTRGAMWWNQHNPDGNIGHNYNIMPDQQREWFR